MTNTKEYFFKNSKKPEIVFLDELVIDPHGLSKKYNLQPVDADDCGPLVELPKLPENIKYTEFKYPSWWGKKNNK